MNYRLLALAGAFLTGFGQPALSQGIDYDWVVNVRNEVSAILPAATPAGYEITVFNDSLNAAPQATIDIPVPAGTTWVSASGTITGCAETVPGTVSCVVPALAADTVATLTIAFLTTAAGVIEVTPVVPEPDADPTNNSETVTTTITRSADIALSLSGPATVPAGGQADYIFSATNLGPYPSEGFTFEFPVPAGLGGVVAPAGCTLAAAVYSCVVATPLDIGETLEFDFSGIASVAEFSTITVTGSVTEVAPQDPFFGNDIASFDTAVTAGSDVQIAKTRSPEGALVVGNTVTFTLDPRYSGDVPFGLTLTDTLPSNYSIVSVTPSGGWVCTVAGQTIDCTLGAGSVPGFDVGLGQIVIVADVVSAGSAVNVTTVASAGPFDPDLANNTADDGGVVIIPPTIDLAIRKSGPQPPLVVVGNSYDYRLGASNLGNTAFVGTVRIEDFLPVGLDATAIGGPGWACTPALPVSGPATITCDIVYTALAPLQPGQTTTDLILTATVTQDGPIINGARVSGIGGNLPDENPGNDTINVDVGGSIPSNAADIRVFKSAANATVAAGQEQVYVIEIANAGPAASFDVVMTDVLSNLQNSNTSGPDAGYVSTVTDAGLAEGLVCSLEVVGPQALRQTCEIDRLPLCSPGVDCPTVTITVRPGTDGGVRTNTATVGSASTADPDLTNNSAEASFTVEARADVTVSKTATPSPAVAGQDLVYVLAAENVGNGLSAAEDVTVVDTLSPNLTFISAQPSSGSCGTLPAGGTITGPGNDLIECNLGTLNNGSQQTVTITVRPNQVLTGTDLENAVSVTTSTIETDGTNNSATVTTPIQPPVFDLLVGKADSVDPVAVGEDTVYTLRVGNLGPSTAENVVVTDTLPLTRLSFQSVSVPADASCTISATPDVIGGTFSCSFAFLGAGESREIFLTMRGVSKGVAVNSATVAADGSALYDTELTNNSTSQNTSVRTRTDVEVTSKVPDNPTPNLGEALTYTVRVTNIAGPAYSEADFVVLSDTLPTGMVLTGPPTAAVVTGTTTALACTGAAGATTFACSFGTVSAGGEIDVTVPVRVVSITSSPQTMINTASVSTTSQDVNLANNSNSGDIEVRASSIAGRVFRDFNDNGVFDANDTGITGITMTLAGVDLNGTPVNRTVQTGAGGVWQVTLLPEGTYAVTQGAISETFLTGRNAIPGSAGGISGGQTSITGIGLPPLTDATDYLFPKVPQARIGLAKRVSTPAVVAADGSFAVTFALNLRNFSLEPLQNVSVTDPLAGASPLFGTHVPSGPLSPGSYTVTAIGGSCAGRNAGFNGSADPVLLSGLTLAATSTCTTTVTLRVQPTVPLPVELSPGVRYRNQATTEGTGAWTGQTQATNPQLFDLSNNGGNTDPNGNGQANEPSENNPTPVTVNFAPDVALVKTADASAVGDPEVGDIVSYAFAVTNTGNVTLADVTLTDILPGIVLVGGPIPVLLPGVTDTTTFTGTYALTQADLATGQVINQATATGTWGVDSGGAPLTVDDLSGTDVANDTPTVVNLGAISLLKSVDLSALSAPPRAGDVVSFGFAITNTGPSTLRNVTLTDPKPGLVLSGAPIAALAPGATDSTTYSATYLLTAADLDAEVIANTATVTGEYASDGSGGFLTVTDDSSTSSSLSGVPSIALIKTADVSGVTTPALPGQVISYGFTVTNTGNVTLTDVTLADVLPGLVVSGGPIPVLGAGAVDATTFTAAYAITQADIDAGRVENSATVTGTFTDPVTGPQPVTDVSGTDNTNDTPTVVSLAQGPRITLVKTADASAIGSPAAPGQQITYGFTITNTGNVTLTGITLSDLLPGLAISGGPIASLAPGDADSTTFTASYGLTQADLDAGQVTNSATATGNYTDAGGTPGTVSDVSGTDQTNDDPTAVPVLQTPGIALVKAVDSAGLQSPPQVGDPLTYSFAVTNTGNVTLTGITLTDILPGIVISGGPIGLLLPGATDAVTFTATYALTQADLDAARVQNQATATGSYATPTGPGTVSDLSGTTVADDDPTVVDLGPAPAIALVKTVDAASLPDPARMGDLLTYAFTVTNTGNVTLTDVTLADSLPGIVITGGPIAVLAPGGIDSTTFTAAYAITQADLDAGIVRNSAVVTGTFTDPGGTPGTVTDTSGTDAGNDAPTEIVLPARPGIAVVKTADTSAMSSPNRLGDPITYRFAVTNTGNVTLANVTLTDPLPGLVQTGGPITSLAPGVTDETTFVGRYAVVESDFNAERVVNQATVSANPPTGPPVTDLSGATVTDDEPTVVPLTFAADVTATKTASTDRVLIGDSFVYTLGFTSNAPGTLRDMTVIDVLPVGLVYTPGSARIDGVAQEPQVTGRTLRWTGLTIAANATLTVRLSVRVTGAAPLGELENRTWLESNRGEAVSNVATATVLREPEHVFDCADIIGKVFDDRNGNGYQDGPEGDASEPGLPAVRVVTTRGYVVTTDQFGRFHVPCAELPKATGSNFTMKLDTRSLPTGYRLTSENPRTIRVTPGKMAKLNFGAAISRVVRIDLDARAFADDGRPSAALRAGIAGLVAQVQSHPSVLRLNYQMAGESEAVARKRLAQVAALVEAAWHEDGGRLRIERTLQRGKVKQ